VYKRLFSFLLATLLILANGNSAFAQLTGGNVFIKGSYVQLGIAPNGAFGSTINAPAGYNARPQPINANIYDPGTNTQGFRSTALGFVADYNKDGFTTGSPAFFGDYFMPGNPQEGFSIQMNGAEGKAWTSTYTNFGTTGFVSTGPTFNGSNASVTNSGGINLATWNGTMGNLSIRQTTRLRDTDLYFTMNIVLKNTSNATINDIYYMRTVDADNEVSITADYATNNNITFQLPNPNDKVLVAAKGKTYTNAYLGLGTKDCRAKVFIANNGILPNAGTPGDYYNNTTGNQLTSGSLVGDVCMGLVFKLGNLAAGDSVSFSYAYILKEQDLDSAVSLTQPFFNYNGTSYASGDTVHICQNSSGTPVNIINGGFYNWTWSPAQGLSTTTGTSNIISLTGTQPKTYTITGVSSNTSICNSSKVLTITVVPKPTPPAPTVTTPVFYCQGSTATALIPNGANYRWYYTTSGGTPQASIIPATTVLGNIAYYVSEISSGCESDRSQVVVSTLGTTSILTHPANTQVCENNNTSLSVTAAGLNLTYQWQVNTGSSWANITSGPIYSGYNSGTLSLSNVPLSMSGYNYRCIVTGTCSGTTTIISNPATLIVNPTPAITVHPLNITQCEGNPATLTCVATGSNISYQWQVNMGTGFTNLSNNATYSGVTTFALTIANTTAAMSGYQYRCVVSAACSPALTSNPSLFSIHALPAIASHPQAVTACEGNTVNFSIGATGTGITYQWESIQGATATPLSNTPPYSGVNTPTLTVANIAATQNGIAYRCKITGTCAPGVTSAAATLNVTTAPKITSQSIDLTACLGMGGDLSVTATGSSLNYQWQMLSGLYFINLTNNANYSGVNSATLNITNATMMQNGSYRCIVTGVCAPADTSVPATVTITNTTTIYQQTPDIASCSGIPQELEVLTTGPVQSYYWQRDAGNGFGWERINNVGAYLGTTSNLLRIISTHDSMHNFKYRCVVNGLCIQPASAPITLSVFAAPALTQEPLSVSTDVGNDAAFWVGTTGYGINYRWQASLDGITYVYINDNSIYSGTHTKLLTVRQVALGQNGTRFRCHIEEAGSCGYADTISDTARLWVRNPSSVASQQFNSKDIVLYPNPVTGSDLFIRQGQSSSGIVSISIMNELGAVVSRQNVSTTGKEDMQVDVSNLPPGNYMLQLNDNQHGNSYLKFTRQ
jgi:hypothetical protein